MEKELAGFQLWLSQKGRKQSTIRTISYSLKRVLRSGCTLTTKGVSSYLFLLRQQGKSGKYLNNIIDAIRVYAQYKKKLGLLKIPYFKEDHFVKATLSDDEIMAFLSLPCPTCRHVSIKGKETIRPTDVKHWNKMNAFWSICAFTGMRMGEAAHLTVEDVDWGRDVFILQDTKINEPRFVPIPPNLSESLHYYIDTVVHDGYLFPNASGKNKKKSGPVIDNVDWHYDFHKRIKRLGIKRKNLTPYSLRHSMITRLLEEDVNIFKVQKIVGHKRLDTTAQYTHLTTKDMQYAITKHPLIRRSTDPKNIIRSMQELIASYALERDVRFNSVKVQKAVSSFIVDLYESIKSGDIITACAFFSVLHCSFSLSSL